MHAFRRPCDDGSMGEGARIGVARDRLEARLRQRRRVRPPEQIRPLKGNAVRFAHTLSRHGRAAASTGRFRPNVLFGLHKGSRLFYSSNAIRASCGDGDNFFNDVDVDDTFLKHVIPCGPTHTCVTATATVLRDVHAGPAAVTPDYRFPRAFRPTSLSPMSQKSG